MFRTFKTGIWDRWSKPGSLVEVIVKPCEIDFVRGKRGDEDLQVVGWIYNDKSPSLNVSLSRLTRRVIQSTRVRISRMEDPEGASSVMPRKLKSGKCE